MWILTRALRTGGESETKRLYCWIRKDDNGPETPCARCVRGRVNHRKWVLWPEARADSTAATLGLHKLGLCLLEMYWTLSPPSETNAHNGFKMWVGREKKQKKNKTSSKSYITTTDWDWVQLFLGRTGCSVQSHSVILVTHTVWEVHYLFTRNSSGAALVMRTTLLECRWY